jgi:hypothetical protein
MALYSHTASCVGDAMSMPKSVLENQLNRLMGGGREYTIDELYSLTGAKPHMQLVTFKRRLKTFNNFHSVEGKWKAIAPCSDSNGLAIPTMGDAMSYFKRNLPLPHWLRKRDAK